MILSSSQEAQKAVSKMSSYLSEFVTGIGVIKNFAKEDFEGKRFTDITGVTVTCDIASKRRKLRIFH